LTRVCSVDKVLNDWDQEYGTLFLKLMQKYGTAEVEFDNIKAEL